MLGWDLHLIYLNVLHLEFFITVLALGLLKTETNTSVTSRMAKGTYTYTDGRKYVGEYKDGKRYRQGTFTFADGSVVEGIWKDGVLKYAQ